MTSLLVGDFGGTNARLAITGLEGPLTLKKEYRCRDFASVADVVSTYLADVGAKPKLAVFGVACPVESAQNITFTNGRWKGVPQNLTELPFDEVHAINDFEAICYSVASLRPRDCKTLVEGQPPFFPAKILNGSANAVQTTSRILVSKPAQRYLAIGPGTGLGVGSGFVTTTGQLIVIGGEGGHTAFAPSTEEELRFKKYLEDEKDILVTNETIASGTGLRITFNACAAVSGLNLQIDDAAQLTMLTHAPDRKTRDAAWSALNVFAKALGNSASAAALTNHAQTVFMGGGVISKLGSYFNQTEFTRAFRSNDLHSNNILLDTPVLQLMHPFPGLLGAQTYARLTR